MDAAELKFIVKAQDDASATVSQIGASFADMGGVIKDQIAAMQALTAALTQNVNASKSSTSAAREHAAAHKSAGEAAKTSGDAHGEASDDIEKHGEAHKKAGESAKEHEEAELGVGRALERVAHMAKEAAEALLAMWASNEMARATVEAAEDTEKAIMAVSRASGMAKDEAKELHEALAGISMRDGNATIEQLDKMAIAAAKMGANAEQAEAFAVAISRITNEGNFSQVTEGIEQILESTEEGVEGVNKFTDALAAMEKHSLHGIEGLIPLISRLAAKSGELGLSSSHLAAYAATFEKLGGRPEMQVMSFEGAVTKLKSIADLGGRQLAELARQTHMTGDEFAKMAREHPEAAYIKLLEVVKSLQKQGADPKDFLSRIGIGDEQAAGLEAMAKHIGDLKKNIADADNSTGQGKKMGEQTKTEFEKAVVEMETAWTEFKAQIGADEIAPLVTTFKALLGIIQEFGLVLGGLSPVMRGVLEALVIGTPAVLGLVKAYGAVKEMLSGIDEYFLRTGEAVKESSETMSKSVEAGEAKSTAAVEGGEAAKLAAIEEAGQKGVVAVQEAEAAKVMATEEGEAAQVLAVEKGGDAMVSKTEATGGRMSKALGASFKSMMGGVLEYTIAAGLALEAGRDFGNLINQQREQGREGVSWTDSALGLWSMVSGDNEPLRKQMQSELDARRKNGAETEGDKKLDKKGQEKTEEVEKEAKAKEEDVGDQSIDDRTKAYKVLNETIRAGLETLDAYGKKNKELEEQQNYIDKAKEFMKNGGDSGYTAEQLNRMQQAVDFNKQMADPLKAQARAMGDAVDKANAFTKAQQNSLEITKALRDLEEKGVLNKDTPDDAAHQGVRSGMEASQEAEKNKSFQEQLISMQNQLALAGALTMREKDRLEIEQQIAALERTMGLDPSKPEDEAKIERLTAILTATKKVNEENAQFKALNPQAEALRSYNDQLEIMNDRLKEGKIDQEEFNREKTKLDHDTLAARDPLGNIAEQQKEEIAQLQIVGKYREADLKTLQEITDLQHQGVALTKEQADAIGQGNRKIQDIKDTQKQMDDLTQTFGSGLSNAISGALAGNKHAFSQFGLSLGKKMMDSAFTNLSKSLEGSLNGMLGGMFGDATKDADKLGALGKEQMIHTAQATITATGGVYINGAEAKGATATAQATGNGAQPNATTQLPGVGSDATIASRAVSAAGSSGLDAGGRGTADALTQHMMQTYGLTREQATGAVGVMGYESGNFQTLQEKNPQGGRGGYGYAQWTGPRRTQFEAWSKQQGLDPSTYAANQGFMDHELQTNYRGTIAALKATNTPQEAARAYEEHYEGMREGGPGIPAFSQHAARAQQYYNEGVGRNAASTAPNTASTDIDYTPTGSIRSYPSTGRVIPKPPMSREEAAALQRQYDRIGHGESTADVRDSASSGPPVPDAPLSDAGRYGRGLPTEYGNYGRGLPADYGKYGRGLPTDYVAPPPPRPADLPSAQVAAANDNVFRTQLAGLGGRSGHLAQDATTPDMLAAGRRAAQQYEEASKAGAASFKTEITKVTPDLGTNFKDTITSAVDKATPAGTSTTATGTAGAGDQSPTGNSGGDAGGLLGGLTGLAGKIPGAAPFVQGFGMLQKLLGGLFSGGGGGGGLFSGLGSLFGALHTGGLVGRPVSMSRYVNPAIFHGAGRFHDGLGDDEFPAILQRGERVLTANQDQRATAMMSRMADMIANSNASTPAGTQRADSGRQNGGRNVTMIVNTPNASSFRSSQPQIMASQHAALQRMGNRHN